jgi:hypothetical protein
MFPFIRVADAEAMDDAAAASRLIFFFFLALEGVENPATTAPLAATPRAFKGFGE